MATTKIYARRRRALVERYIDWRWHFPLDGKVWVQHPQTGEIVRIGKIEP